MGAKCALDSVQEPEVVEAAADVGRKARTFRGRLGDVSGCASVRENRTMSMMHIVVHAGIIASVVALVATRSSGPGTWMVLDTLGLLSTMLAAFHLRHAISLAAKLAWHGFGPRTRALVALSLVGFLAPYVLGRFRQELPRAAVTGLLTAMALTSAGTIAMLFSTIRNPETAYFTAVMSTANRLANPQAIARLKDSFSIDTA